MPIFDFKCPKCNATQQDLLRKYDDVVVCECGTDMVKMLSTPAFMFTNPHGTDKGRLMQVSKKKRFGGNK